MTTFEAVRTTGIYCHPTCSATPNPENVTSYHSAAAAEAAGFRACLRCRPYRSHDGIAWLGTPELVCRAVRMILDGALDDSTEEAFASRLGVSGRHLRRLFDEVVGASPAQVARSRRAHFARRLLDDTDLTITDIAFAAGFGSVRQMTRVMTSTFRAAPTELRTRRRVNDRLVADGGLDCRVPFTPPLDWDRLLAFLAMRAIPGVESVNDGVYRRTIDLGTSTGAVEVRRGGADHLIARFHLPTWDGLIHHVANVRRLFDLDHDPAEAARVLGQADELSPWPTGLRVPGCWNRFEIGVRAIVGQQVSVAGATTTLGKITAAHGRQVDGLDAFGLWATFPTPSSLRDADLPMPRARRRDRASTRCRVEDGDIVLDPSIERTALEAALCAIDGIGPWTARYVAMRLGDDDAFLASDLHIKRALGDSAEKKSGLWRPFRAYATVRLWDKGAETPNVETAVRSPR